MAIFESHFSIGQTVTFLPMFRHTEEMGIAEEEMYGEIVAIRFTKAKVFYDIVDDYHAKVFSNVDSMKVFVIEKKVLQES